MSEEIEAALDGARLHRNSGRGVIEKGDASLGPFTIDYKEYDQSFSVSRANWAKATTDARKMGNQPAFKLVLGKDQKIRVWVVSDMMFKEMLEAWEEKYGDQG